MPSAAPFDPFKPVWKAPFRSIAEEIAAGRAKLQAKEDAEARAVAEAQAAGKPAPAPAEPSLIIIQDTREQTPWIFHGQTVRVGTLQTGDYSVAGHEAAGIAIERKSLPDLIGSLTAGRDRFKREIERLRAFESAHLIIEATEDDIAAGRYRSAMNPHAAIQSLRAIGARGIAVWFARTHPAAALLALDLMRHYVRIKTEDAARAAAPAVSLSEIPPPKKG